MGSKPTLSILIPWCQRDELRITLAANAPVFRAHDAEILILNCGGDRERLRGLIAASKVAGVRQLDLSVPAFNRCLALNAGLGYARADTVFTLDTDVAVLDPLAVEALDEGSFVTIDSVYESVPREMKHGPDPAITSRNSAFVEFTFRDGAKVRHQFGLRDAFGNIRAGTGLLLARRDDLLRIGGYNSDLDSWGWEDDDILIRLQYVLGIRRVQSGAALHLTHDDNSRFQQESRNRSNQRNFIKCCRNYNNGVFVGTYHADSTRLIDNVTESLTDAAVPELARGAVGNSQPLGPDYCGNDNRMVCETGPDSVQWPPSIGALLLEAALLKTPLEDCDVLHVGSGGSRLAAKLSSRCRHYTRTLRDCLPSRAFDVIIDISLTRQACCRRHFRTLIGSYASLLAPAGWLATTEPGLEGAPNEPFKQIGEADFSTLVGEFGLGVSNADVGIYKVSRCGRLVRASVTTPTSASDNSG